MDITILRQNNSAKMLGNFNRNIKYSSLLKVFVFNLLKYNVTSKKTADFSQKYLNGS